MILERVKEVFEKSGKNQSDLARTLDVTPQYISKLIKGNQEPSERMILAILRSFPNVSEKWLREGEGDMYLPEEDNDAKIAAELVSSDRALPTLIKFIVERYFMLDDDQKEIIDGLLKEAIQEIADKNAVKEMWSKKE